MVDKEIELTIIGPYKQIGGIQTYITQQTNNLPDYVTTTVYNTEISGAGISGILKKILHTIIRALLFPFEGRPDIVHIHTSHSFSFIRKSYYVLVSKYVLCVPTVLHVHGSYFDDFLMTESRILAAIQKLVFQAADEVIVLSSYWEEVVTNQTPQKDVVVFPNGVSYQKFTSDANRDGPSLVFISHLIERKGVVELIHALKTNLPEMDDWDVHIAGDGPLAPQVEQLAREFDSVTYHGYVSEDKKRDLLKEGSIFVLPSHGENLPIALIEAMAASNAIVSTDVGAIPELVGDGGIIVAPGDEDSLSAALGDLTSDVSRVKRLGKQNRERVKEEYNWEHLGPELVSLYEELLDDG